MAKCAGTRSLMHVGYKVDQCEHLRPIEYKEGIAWILTE